MFNSETTAAMGSSAACDWFNDSTQLVVSFDEEFDDTWSSNATIQLSSG